MIEIGDKVTVAMMHGHNRGTVKKINTFGKQLTKETTYEVHGDGFITVTSARSIVGTEPPMNKPVLVHGNGWWCLAVAVPYKRPQKHKPNKLWRWMSCGGNPDTIRGVYKFEELGGKCSCKKCDSNKCGHCVATDNDRTSCDYLHPMGRGK